MQSAGRFSCVTGATVLTLGLALNASGQSVTYVSVQGSDANPCDLSSPCRTVGAALAAVAAGGEVVLLTSGDYAPFIVNKSASIVAPGGVEAVVLRAGSASHAINVTAASGRSVVLRGLTVRTTGATFSGTGIQAGAADLNVEHCVIEGAFVTGLRLTGKAVVTDTTVRGAMDEQAILQTGVSHVLYERLTLDTSALDGLKVEGADARATVRFSTFVRNRKAIRATAGAHAIVDGSVFTANATAIGADSGSTITVSNSTFTDNTTAVAAGGTRVTFRNNTMAANGSNGTFSSTLTLR